MLEDTYFVSNKLQRKLSLRCEAFSFSAWYETHATCVSTQFANSLQNSILHSFKEREKERRKRENNLVYFSAFRDFHELAKGLRKIIAALQLRPRRSASGGLFYEMQYSKEANELRKTPSCSILELLTFRLRLTLNNSTSAFY